MPAPHPPAAILQRRRGLRAAAVALVLIGAVGLAVPPRTWLGSAITWEGLLAPYTQGAPLPGGYTIAALRRGLVNEVVVDIVSPAGTPGAEVHLVPRGCWSGLRESASFTIAYETSNSPAAQREEITAALAETVRGQDRGLPGVDAIPLRGALDARAVAAMLRGTRGALLLFSLAVLAGLALSRSPRLAYAGLGVGSVDLLARFSGAMHGTPSCPGEPVAIIDLGIRALQLAWAVSIVASPWLAWRAARAMDLDPRRLLLVVGSTMLLATAAIWQRDDEPLHANWHAWREAREVLLPWSEFNPSTAPFLHGRGGIALQWLLASGEEHLIGSIDPWRISRVAGAAAAGATAFLVALLLGSTTAGLAAGAVLACMPLARMLALSGSTLAVAEWLLPWTLALLIAAGRSGDRLLLAGAALAAGLGTLTHTAMLAWPAGLAAAWLLAARSDWRWSRDALLAGGVVGGAWAAQLAGVYAMVASRNQGQTNLLDQARSGLLQYNLMLDAAWVSPALLPLAGLGALAGLRAGGGAIRASTAALIIVATPFFAVMVCSSDAVRYQGALLGLLTSLAVVGLWRLPYTAVSPGFGVGVLRFALLTALALLPLPAMQPPTDPAVLEQRLIEAAVRRMPPDMLVVLPAAAGETGHVHFDFPEFLLPSDARVVVAGDPAAATHHGPRLLYLGLACISWETSDGSVDPSGIRPECRALRADAQPWAVRSLAASDIPRTHAGAPWTFFQLTTDV
ncbi:MAG: hypothetical protein ABI629_13805, partial [bacterium]